MSRSWRRRCAWRVSPRPPAPRYRSTAAMSASSEANPVETLRWDGRRLELIDQRALPARLEYVSCANAAEVAEAIRSMVVRGAPAIGCAAAFGVALEARRQEDCPRAEFDIAMETAFRNLAASRPTAVNLFWALDRMRAALGPGTQEDPKAAAARLAEAALALHRHGRPRYGPRCHSLGARPRQATLGRGKRDPALSPGRTPHGVGTDPGEDPRHSHHRQRGWTPD